MTTMELLTLLSIVFGPIAAVSITLWNEKRKKNREQKVTMLRMLMETRHTPSDPNFSLAVNLIPVEFAEHPAVMTAYKEFIQAASTRLDGSNDDDVIRNTSTKSVRLIYEVAKTLGYDIRETDLQTTGYSSDGWVNRELVLIDSQRATRDLVNVLIMQTRLLAGATLSDAERRYIGLPPAEGESTSVDQIAR